MPHHDAKRHAGTRALPLQCRADCGYIAQIDLHFHWEFSIDHLR